MLFPTHTVTVTRRGVTDPLVTNRRVRIVAPPIDRAVLPDGQPVPTVLQDNGANIPNYTKGDFVTITARLGSGSMPAVTQYTIGFVDSKGDLAPAIPPYVACELVSGISR